MSESSLSIAKTELEAEIGIELGYGRGTNYSERAWTTKQQARITANVKSGLRQFYFPAFNGQTYEWSFLRPTVQLALGNAMRYIDLPDDYAYFVGPVTLLGSDRAAWEVRVCGVGQVHEQYFAYPDSSGQPLLAAIEAVKGTSADKGQRYRLHVWPESNTNYTVQIQYALCPQALSGDRPYAYGGPAHTETIIAACKAAVEEFDGQRGVKFAKFQERLQASITIDRKNKPQTLGYNGDGPAHWSPKTMRHGWGSLVTLNGSAM